MWFGHGQWSQAPSFSGETKTLENIPPTQAALFQHIKRALLQASFYWNQATSVCQRIPDHSEWDWRRDGDGIWSPYCTSLADASKTCSIILHCGCEKSCTGNCKCCRAAVGCTTLCKCERGCFNNDYMWNRIEWCNNEQLTNILWNLNFFNFDSWTHSSNLF